MMSTILVSTWENGLFSIAGNAVRQELRGRAVCSLTADGAECALAIVDGHSLYRRTAAGEWTEIANSDFALSCCVRSGDAILVGTDDARLLRVDRDGAQNVLTGFDSVAGRDKWYAGTAIVDGKTMGPPLGIRSIAAACDGTFLLANVHVGGIPRSDDSGMTWAPTIDIECDVHQVYAHPTRPEVAIAASALGLCMSRDAGASWSVVQGGLHALHCSAVALGKHDLFVSASFDPFSPQGAVYRRPIDDEHPLQPLGGGMPKWTDGIVDTNCIAARDSTVAVIDRSGRLYVSADDGATWTSENDRLASPSGLLIC